MNRFDTIELLSRFKSAHFWIDPLVIAFFTGLIQNTFHRLKHFWISPDAIALFTSLIQNEIHLPSRVSASKCAIPTIVRENIFQSIINRTA